MKRRAYLVTAAAATLGGCSALTDSDTSDEPEPDDDDGNGDSDSPEPVDEDPGSFDQFDDLSMWTVMEGSLELDAERAYVGEQSGRMEATEGRATSDDQTTIRPAAGPLRRIPCDGVRDRAGCRPDRPALRYGRQPAPPSV